MRSVRFLRYTEFMQSRLKKEQDLKNVKLLFFAFTFMSVETGADFLSGCSNGERSFFAASTIIDLD